MISGYKSIKSIIAKLYRDLGVNYELPEDSIIEWVAEALNLIGAFAQYSQLEDCLDLSNGKTKLPCNFHKLVSITYEGHPMYWSDRTNAKNYGCEECSVPVCQNSNCNTTFYINDSYIITNIDKTITKGICVVYLGIPTDAEGYPLVPDDVMYDKALSAYVVMMLDRIEWRKGKLPDKVKEDSQFEWQFYVNSARGAANMPNVQQLENLKNIMRRLLPVSNDYKRDFKNFNTGEQLNLQ